MATLAIIKDFHVVQEVRRGFRTGPIPPSMDAFPFERGKETFGHRIIVTIPSSTHAAGDPVGLQKRLEFMAGILTAAIGVMNETRGRCALSQCHGESL